MVCFKNRKIDDWNELDPDWRIISPGLCFEARCLNRKCEAFNKMVIINMGVSIIFEFGTSNENDIKCPMCKLYVKPKTFGFFKCSWQFVGVKQTRDGPKRLSCEWKTDDECYFFHNNEELFSKWDNLVIETTSLEGLLEKWLVFLPSEDKSRKTNSSICTICLDDSRNEMCKLNCKHSFHESCLEEWKKHSQIPNCPLCRSEIIE